MLGVALCEHVALAGIVELTPSELANRLEQDVSDGAITGGVGGDHRLVDECHEQVGDVVLVDSVTAADLLRRGECEARGEHTEPTEDQPFVRTQQVVAPLDRAEQGPLAAFGVPVGRGEQAEAFVEPIENLSRRQRTGTRRREFQGQRNAVEMAADAHHRSYVVRRHGERRRRQLRPFGEQADSVVPIRLIDRGILVWQRQGRHPVERFTCDTEPFPARGQHAEVRARRQQVPAESRRRVDDLFAVVEDQHDPLGTDVLGHRANQWCPGHPGHGEALRDLVDQHVTIANGAQFGDAKPVWEVTEEFFGHAHRQPRLAGSPRARQRHQPVLVEQTDDLAQLTGSTDETRQLRREVVVRTLHGSQTRELSNERRVADLIDPLGFGQTAQAMRPEVDQFGVRG